MGRKGQIAGQVFIYMIAIVVVGLIVVYGYSAIRGFTQRGEEVEYLTLKTSIENSVRAIVSDYGSIKRPDISVPGKYEMVCFVDKDATDASIAASAICDKSAAEMLAQGDDKYHQPIICAAWKTHNNNVFMVPDGSDAFSVDATLVIDENMPTAGHHFICFDVINNKIKMQMEGLGDRVKISQY